jgi:xanthine dehydrogenase accessory factor
LHLGTHSLLEFFQAHQDDESLVLASITATQGSTYRKPGAMMLIGRDNTYAGMISGGCLEGDLLHHAAEVFASGQPKAVTYDMHAGDELVWGLGLGCDGVIHLLLNRLDRGDGFATLQFIQRSLAARMPVLMALVTGPGEGEPAIGTMGLYNSSGQTEGNARLAQRCGEMSRAAWPNWRQRVLAEGEHTFMVVNLLPSPRVLLCGGGPDAVPVARQVHELGWECIIADHRPAFARAERFPPGCEIVLCRPQELSGRVDLAQVDAAVIMSHHLDNDATYLRQLAHQPGRSAPRYVGVLGPSARRERLKEMAECPRQLVYGPVGLDIGAELPESIALAIVAEIHAALNGRDGQSLTTGPVGGTG